MPSSTVSKIPFINLEFLTSAPSSENSSITLHVLPPVILLKAVPSEVISSPFLNKSLTSSNNF